MGQTDFTTGDVSGSQTLTDSDHLYPSHVNELRAALNLLESLLDPDDETLTTSGKIETSADIETTGGALKGDTVSESTAGAGVTVDSLLIKDGRIVNWDAWMPAQETWTYASSTTFTITGDKTSKYKKEYKIKFDQPTDGTTYFRIKSVSYSSPDTTVTIYGSTVYDLDNEAITSPYYSSGDPVDFPDMKTLVTAYRSNASYQSLGATVTDIQNDAVLYDTLSEYNTSTYTFTAKNEGYYKISGQLSVDNIASGKNVYASIWSSSSAWIQSMAFSSAAASDIAVPLSDKIIYLLAGDTIRLRGGQNTGSTQYVLKTHYQTYLSIERIL